MWFLIHCALNKEHLKSEFSFSREGAKIEMLAGGSSFILYVLYYVAVRFYLEWELIILRVHTNLPNWILVNFKCRNFFHSFRIKRQKFSWHGTTSILRKILENGHFASWINNDPICYEIDKKIKYQKLRLMDLF